AAGTDDKAARRAAAAHGAGERQRFEGRMKRRTVLPPFRLFVTGGGQRQPKRGNRIVKAGADAPGQEKSIPLVTEPVEIMVAVVFAIGDVVQPPTKLKHRAGQGLLLDKRDGMRVFRVHEHKARRVLKNEAALRPDGPCRGVRLCRSGPGY